MWHIVNTTNKVILDAFKEQVSDKVFFILLDISKKLELRKITIECGEYEKWKDSIFYQKSTEKGLLDYIFKYKVSGVFFENLFTDIVTKYTRTQILEFYSIYIEQNNNVNFLNYNVVLEKISIEFKTIFVDFYYDKFFTDETIWATIYGEPFDRRKFHENFKKDNKDLLVCPYCDIETTIIKSNNNIEHFLPKAKYPFLSMNALNLASSCYACNRAEEGKGENVKSPIVSPYNIQIGDFIKFSIDEPNKKIILDSNYIIDESIENYIDLLHLKEKYAEERVFLFVTNKVQSILEDIPYYDHDLISYIEKRYIRFKGKEPLTIAVKSILA